MTSTRLEDRVTRAAEATLAEQKYVSAIDVLLRLGWLTPPRLDRWRQGRVRCLEQVVEASLGKQSRAMRTLRTWAGRRGLKPSETVYVARTRDRRRLTFSVSGKPDIEQAYRTHWVSPELSPPESGSAARKGEQGAGPGVASPLNDQPAERVDTRSPLRDGPPRPLDQWTRVPHPGTARYQTLTT